VLLSGEVHSAEPVPLLLASLRQVPVVVREFDLTFALEATLTDAQFEALEQRRRGADLQLTVRLAGLLLAVPEGRVGYLETEEFHTLRVGRVHWAEQLGRLGLAVGVHVVARLPLGGSPDGPVAQAGQRLPSVQAAVVAGRY